MNDKPVRKSIQSWRIQVLYIALILLGFLFIGRLYQFQILEGSVYQAQADENRFTEVRIAAERGVIYDRNGQILVRNIPTFNIVITPALLPDSEAETQATYLWLSELTGVPISQEGEAAARCVPGRGITQLVQEGATNAPYETWPIACDVDESIARVINETAADHPGVSVEIEPVREYPTGELTANIIGYLGPISEQTEVYYESLGFVADRDKVGYSGIEYQYQEILAGTNGLKLVEIDVAGQELREIGEVIQPVAGNSLRLTIDTRLQAAAQTALRNRMEFINRYANERRSPIGVVIAMNPNTGEILAMVSEPTYENNRFARFIPANYYQQLVADDRGKPLINHAIQLAFPPGSTYKLVTGVGSLNEGVITPNETLFDPGKITIANRYFPNDPGKAKDFVCWNEDGHGDVDYLHALAWSCNIYFYKICGGYENEVDPGLGIDLLGQYARALGYGDLLGIDLPGEYNGLVPTRDWKRRTQGENWSTGDTYNAATGQGYVLATPLQVLNSAATIANGGRVMWPHLVQEILDGEGNVVEAIEPRVLWDLTDGVLTEGTPDINVESWVIELTQQGMHMVTLDGGTVYGYGNLDTISSAGKTGTGEFCDTVAFNKGLCEPGNWPTHAWYVAFAPYENPEIVVVAMVYNGGEGAVTSGPIVKQVLETYFTLKAIDAAGAP
ncbi:MAG: penicillin-binding protein 2 [Anaerolineales bacterium]|nr:penicillin-binding protein 2 [Anaerolineales bacterium]